MIKTEDLINLGECPSPPPVYNMPNAQQNRQTQNQTPISHHQNGHLFPTYIPQPQPVQPQFIPVNQNQMVMPVVDISKLPLSMQRNYYIQNNYPTSYVIFHCVCLLVLALSMIAAEIVVLYNLNYYIDSANQIAGGTYSGGLLVFTALITLISISCRNYCCMVTSVFFHLISMIVTFISTVVFHAIAISENHCVLIFDMKRCQPDIVYALGAFLIAISLVTMVMCLIFSIYMQTKVVGSCSKNSRFQNQLPQNIYQPNIYNQQVRYPNF